MYTFSLDSLEKKDHTEIFSPALASVGTGGGTRDLLPCSGPPGGHRPRGARRRERRTGVGPLARADEVPHPGCAPRVACPYSTASSTLSITHSRQSTRQSGRRVPIGVSPLPLPRRGQFSQRQSVWSLSRNDSPQRQSGPLRETSAADSSALWPKSVHTPSPAARGVAATEFLKGL